jgi:hypothetical protein
MRLKDDGMETASQSLEPRHRRAPAAGRARSAVAAAMCGALLAAPLSGAAQMTDLADLMYQPGDYATRTLPQRGYELAGTASARGNAYWQYWWNTPRAQCVRLAVNDHRVTQVIATDARDCNRGSGAPAQPTPPADNSDLVRQAEDYSARELPRRGYVLTHSAAAGSGYFQYWWNPQREQCLRVAVNGGRVSQTITTDEHDCNQTVSGSKGPSKGAQVAIAAAAIAGVAVLAHKSHEAQKDRAEQAPQDVAEFERGYRDALYAQGYHNYSNRPDYSDGYNKGSEKRAAETRYRSTQGQHSGYAGYVSVNDLVGARGSSADGELRARGFVDKGGYQQSGRAYSMWWNARTRQCLNMTVRDGRVEHFESIVEGNCL